MISAPDRSEAIQLIKEANAHGARLPQACAELKITLRTFRRWKAQKKEFGTVQDRRPVAKRKAPKNKLSKEEVQEVINVLNSKEFVDLSPCEIVPALLEQDRYLCSESTMYRIMRAQKMNTHRGRTALPVRRPISTHVATAPNQVWMWDITYLKGAVKGTFYYLYLISDLFSRDIVGWEVWPEESAEHAAELIWRTVQRQGRLATEPLVLHSDNGSPMKGATMLATLQRLGITPSNSRPRVSNDNAYAESLFKTLKYRPNYQPEGFNSLEEARLWCTDFVQWYNDKHHHSGIQYLTPEQVHSGQGQDILDNRRIVLEKAKEKHPERWNGRPVRCCQLPGKVYLNPEKEASEQNIKETTRSKEQAEQVSDPAQPSA